MFVYMRACVCMFLCMCVSACVCERMSKPGVDGMWDDSKLLIPSCWERPVVFGAVYLALAALCREMIHCQKWAGRNRDRVCAELNCGQALAEQPSPSSSSLICRVHKHSHLSSTASQAFCPQIAVFRAKTAHSL